MSREIAIGVIITAALIGGFVYWQYGAMLENRAPAAAPAAPPPAPAPRAHYPVPVPTDPPAELPALADSDGAIVSGLEDIFGAAILKARLARQRVIARMVATIDSLDRDPVPMDVRPLAPVPGLLATETSGDQLVLSRQNAARYTPMIKALKLADADAIAELYLRHYPLFQQAYQELGYPDGYFNNRLVAIIDHLLESPDRAGPLALQRPKVLYQFADPELERLSSGQKLLIRMGPEHAAVVKAKLREIRAIVAANRTEPT